jgi:NTE family protein
MTDHVIGDYNLDDLSNNYLALYFSGRSDTFDNEYYPSKGYKLGADYQWYFLGFPNDFKHFQIISFHASGVIQGCDFFSIIPSFDSRFLLGSNIPFVYTNLIGGRMAGRYLDQQIPFIGINNAVPLRNKIIVGGLNFRFKLFKNNYLSCLCDLSDDFDDFEAEKDGSTIFGTGLEYGYNSIVGPLKMNIHWSSETHRVGAYFSLGFDF